MTSQPEANDGNAHLARQLGTFDAVVIGLGSMIGAGVFSAFGPAAQVAGTGLLIGLVIAAAIAFCNAISSAQLAAVYPVSGGTYIYGRERLGNWWGFTAGWGFVIGKTASCAAMALTFASYVIPNPWWVQRIAAATAVAALTALNCRGVTKTALLTRVLVASSLTALAVVVIGIATGKHSGSTHLDNWWSGDTYGILQSAGLLFFAFAGYARIATMGEEVRDPSRTIPRAIPIALLIVVCVYSVVGFAALTAAGAQQIAASSAPLVTAVEAADASQLIPIVQVGSALAALGALLALIAGVGRTSLAMARNHDLPHWLSAVHPRYKVPHHAEIVLAVAIVVLVAIVDLREAIGFSSFGVLVYYAIANASAFTQPSSDRRWPRWLNVLGLVGCLTLVVTLPWQSVVAGIAMFAIGLIGRLTIHRISETRE